MSGFWTLQVTHRKKDGQSSFIKTLVVSEASRLQDQLYVKHRINSRLERLETQNLFPQKETEHLGTDKENNLNK